MVVVSVLYQLFISEFVLRETYLLAKRDHTLTQLASVSAYSIIDAICRFWLKERL